MLQRLCRNIDASHKSGGRLRRAAAALRFTDIFQTFSLQSHSGGGIMAAPG
jgi:hypothetical protein